MKHLNLKERLNKETAFHTLRGIAFAAGGFSLILCILLIANFAQIKAVDPLNSPSLTSLMSQLEEDPQNDELRDQIRALDLLARKAYFTSQWQLRTGGLLLLGGIIVLIIALRFMADIRSKLPAPEGCADADASWLTAIKARKWIALAGTMLFSTSLIAAILTGSDINSIDFAQSSSGSASASDASKYWPNFRGPGGNGVAAVDHAPTEWNGETGDGIAWKVETPKPGYSSPVIWANSVFVTGADKQIQEVYCYDATDGSLIWQKEIKDIEGSPENKPRVHSDTGYAPSTVATDGQYVCAVFPTGDLVCLNFEGNQVWAQNLGVPDNHYGHSSSLIIYDNLLIVQWDQNSKSRLLGLNIATGETVWRSPRTAISWSSPIIVNTGSRDELILTNSTSIDSYNPRTGVKYWGMDILGGEMGPSAVFADGWVFGANDYATTVGIDLTSGRPRLAWEYDENLPDTASPLATKDHLILACSYGYIICLDAKTGEFLWEQEYDDGFYASPILVGNTVYATDLMGVTHIFELADEYKPVADSPLGESSSCTPAFVDGKMYTRGQKYLYCISGD